MVMTPDYLRPCPNQAEHGRSTCPGRTNHEPASYLAWHEWAARMAKSHTQHRCPGCGYWRVWRPRESSSTGGQP